MGYRTIEKVARNLSNRRKKKKCSRERTSTTTLTDCTFKEKKYIHVRLLT